MSYLRWTDDLSVGVTDVDAQHKGLVDLVNALHEAMLAGSGKSVLGGTIQALIDYTITHFATEEAYFDSFNYPGASVHKAEHQGFIERVGDFKRGFDEDRLMLSLEVMDFLSDWLVNHIQRSDKAFGPFLNEHGVV